MLKEEFTEWANNGGIDSEVPGYIDHAIFLKDRNSNPKIEEKRMTSYIIANIAWNSSDWKGITEDKTNFKWTQEEGNIPHESWNFDFDNARNSEEKIYGFTKFTHAPKTAESNKFFVVFRSRDKQGKNKIVGFYGDSDILKIPKQLSNIQSTNVIGNKRISILLENKIDDSDNKLLFGKQKVGQIGFNIITKDNSISIVEEAIKLNPNQINKLNELKDWLVSTIPYSESEIGESNMSKTEELKELLKENKNLILHGAPGTGKTHLAKEIAKSMGCTNNEIGFVQFHPSYDYTDFVEGLRPNDRGTFDRIDGIFKEFCSNAIESKKEYEKFQKSINKNEVDVQSLFSQYCMYVEKKIIESENGLFPFSNSMNIRRIARNKQGAPISIEIATSLEAIPKQNLSSSIFYRDYIDYKNGKIKSFQDVRPTFESKTKFHGNADYYFKLYQLVEEFEKSENFDSKNPFFDTSGEKKLKKYVFIIDEINRGELSKIFGELFFSIDSDYRGLDENGRPKGLVKTQYQNLVDEDDVFSEGFYIPENVYIIGTMNDIDRSVESMDFAMRRRFIFEEVTAKESAENMNLSDDAKEIMKRINDVISKTDGLNEAYEIGGAYFLNVSDYDKLWKIKLSSLIKEYLRGIDDDGSKFKKIRDAYFNKQSEEPSENDE